MNRSCTTSSWLRSITSARKSTCYVLAENWTPPLSLRKLDPFVGPKRIFRIGGRTQKEAELPDLSHLAEQIIGECHCDYYPPAVAQTAAAPPAPRQPPVAQSPAQTAGAYGPPAHGSFAAVFAIGHRWSSALRPTAKVWLKDRYGRRHETVAALDTCADRNFISRSDRRKLITDLLETYDLGLTMVGDARDTLPNTDVVELYVENGNGSFSELVEFSVLNSPPVQTSPIPLDGVNLSYLSDFQLADRDFGRHTVVHVLLGSSFFGRVVGSRIAIPPPGQFGPAGYLTPFGVVLCGAVSSEARRQPRTIRSINRVRRHSAVHVAADHAEVRDPHPRSGITSRPPWTMSPSFGKLSLNEAKPT